MRYFLIFIGYVTAYCLIKFRQKIGDGIGGDQSWMESIGGIYNFLMILGVILFFWCTVELTGTARIFFFPLYWILGGAFGG
jgi:hypothetical protein